MISIRFDVKKFLSIFILCAFIFWLAVYLYLHGSDFRSLSLVSPWLILVLIVLFMLNYFIIGLATKILLKPLYIKLGFFESIAISIMAGFYNLVTPFKGGFAARAVYLNKKHSSSYTDFVAASSADYIMIFLAAGILGVISSSIIFMYRFAFNLPVFLIFVATTSLCLITVYFYRLLPFTKYSLVNYFVAVVNSYYIIRKSKRTIVYTFVLSVAQVLIGAVMLMIQFKIFNIDLNFIEAVFLSSIGMIGLAVAITPAGLGISEAIMVFASLILGISPISSLSAALLGRAVSIVVLFILGPLASYLLLKARPYHQRLDPRKTDVIDSAYKDLSSAYHMTKYLKDEFNYIVKRYSRKRSKSGAKIHFDSKYKPQYSI